MTHRRCKWRGVDVQTNDDSPEMRDKRQGIKAMYSHTNYQYSTY
jgi:hypothetical protein